MAHLAFLGLGQMGAPMAERLLGAGHRLAVWNRTPTKADALVARGAARSTTPAAAVSDAEAVFTMLADPAALEAVLCGPGGALAALRSGTVLFEMSTVGPAVIADAAARLPSGVTLVDAPVLGSVPQAESGTLKIFVGSTAEDYARWSPLLLPLGTPLHAGPQGAGASLKLVVNLTLGTLMAGLGEALALGDALGVDAATMLDVLADSPIGVPVRAKRTHFETGTYAPRFKLALARKDLQLVREAAVDAGCALGLAGAAASWFDAATRAGLGDLDYSAVVAHIRKRPAAAPA